MLNLLLLATPPSIPAPTHRNLVVNGDFSAGRKGFQSDYVFDSNLGPDGNFFIGANPHDYHPGGASIGDHTSGKGLMLIANGSQNANKTVWQETLKVTPNHKYAFGMWAASWGELGTPFTDPSPARLVVTINGRVIGPAFEVQPRDGAWTKFSAPWASGSARAAVIRIVDQNLEIVGNDFALDDIVFHD